MRVIHSVHPDDLKNYHTEQIRERFLLDKLVQPDAVNCVYTHYDRIVAGVAHPVSQTLTLDTYDNLKAAYFLERREMGIINVAGDGTITVDGQAYNLKKLDCLYIGKGAKQITFAAADAAAAPVFYLLSAPAHQTYPTVLMTIEQAEKVEAGAAETANKRTINKYIHAAGIPSCQLVMGLTILHPGSVWNTMPPHVHGRRMEAYFYFDIPAGQRVFHLMGEESQTRHLLIDNYEAVVSPPWSMHSGAGTGNYSFIWGMGGENLDYTDMDAIKIENIR
ncbi:5-dehydro-4-deoxy-D-glucuronate isomerase [Mucilaginibacter phyllosphaerae]|uniref:4-deoxy-L-threo-5-hexosulose-uronate ketol-isomerase n=1 Tax=Mucilaginibacter phyllosphaerae TaxID=1812349 RepID=A0ABR6I3S5_9SPHI|nr:5-dehydro-4-deoxy-D-glucuronate isomerase [Mucilaginibacter phyllosphaerae]MBB3967684.1 4-deoxy-L-threo-5-hexosulose-uronate ketol-isomerase [Mucilaginibacter phyllosphaerae]